MTEMLTPVECLSPNALVMNVKEKSNVKSLVKYAVNRLADSSVHQILWKGRGDAVSKVIACAELTKKLVRDLYQVNQATTEPVNQLRNDVLPAFFVLLSRDVIDDCIVGYQAPNDSEGLFERRSERIERGVKTKKRTRKTELPEDDETLLSDLVKRKEFDKRVRLEKRKKREIMSKTPESIRNDLIAHIPIEIDETVAVDVAGEQRIGKTPEPLDDTQESSKIIEDSPSLIEKVDI